MTDDTNFVPTTTEFHPCSIPHGTLDYNPKILTPCQQEILNEFKLNQIRENQKYLARHPEIRALIMLVLRHILLNRPRTNLHEHVGKFFSRSRSHLESAVQNYLDEREPHVTEGDSAVVIEEESSESSDSRPNSIMDLVLQKAFERLGLHMDDDHWDLKEALKKVTPSEPIVREIIEELMDGAVSQVDRNVFNYLLKVYGEGEGNILDEEMENLTVKNEEDAQ